MSAAETKDVTLEMEERETTADSARVNQDVSAYVVKHDEQVKPEEEFDYVKPPLLKRVPSEELLFKPIKSFKMLLCVSYLSMIFCCVFGYFANQYAWRAMQYKNALRYPDAQLLARRTRNCMLWGLGLVITPTAIAGFIILIIYLAVGL